MIQGGIDKSGLKHLIDNAGLSLQKVDTGWINTSDWTNRHFGSINLNYNTLVGTFQVGETITEATSGFTGIVMTDSGTILILRDVVGGFFTNGRQVTGSTSGATANVNGNTKNVDTDFYHGFDTVMQNIIYVPYWSETGSDTNCRGLRSEITGHGYDIDYSTMNSSIMRTGKDGFSYLTSTSYSYITTQNWYYKIVGYRFL